jgi:hypothetical protein
LSVGVVSAEGGAGVGLVTLLAAETMSLATDFPAAATPLSTPTALFRSPIVSEIAVADTFPARNVSSTPSVKRVKRLVTFVGSRAPYFDVTNSR